MAPRSHIDHMSGNNAAGDSLTVHMAMLLIINYSCWQLLKLCKAGVGSDVWRGVKHPDSRPSSLPHDCLSLVVHWTLTSGEELRELLSSTFIDLSSVQICSQRYFRCLSFAKQKADSSRVVFPAGPSLEYKICKVLVFISESMWYLEITSGSKWFQPIGESDRIINKLISKRK